MFIFTPTATLKITQPKRHLKNQLSVVSSCVRTCRRGLQTVHVLRECLRECCALLTNWSLAFSAPNIQVPVEEEQVDCGVQQPHRHSVVEQPQHEDRMDPIVDDRYSTEQ